MKRVLLALAFAAVPAMAFLNHPGKLALARGASAASQPTPSRGVTDSVNLRQRSAPLAFSFPNLKMGLFDFLGATAGKRDYADLKKGSLQEEAAVYAAAREVKAVAKDGHALATFGGGCFWGIELAYARVPGVISTCVGYINGAVEDPSYELVCTGASGHTEAVHLTYDPKVVSYKELCKVLFSRINPSLKDQVGNDRGTQYRHGVYYYNEAQKKEAEEVFGEVQAKLGSGAPFFTELCPAEVFYPAEEYHQQYLWDKGGRGGNPQSAEKGCTDTIRCYG